jgi:hypothetical protein
MTATSPSGTPLILSILALVVSLVVGIGAVLMARANVQRQIQVTTREAWMREFREQVAGFLDHFEVYQKRSNWLSCSNTATTLDEKRHADAECREAQAGFGHHFKVIRLLIAERGSQYATFVRLVSDLLENSNDTSLEQLGREGELTTAAEDIMRSERAAIEVDPWWPVLRRSVGAVGRLPSRFVAWSRRGPPRFPNLP